MLDDVPEQVLLEQARRGERKALQTLVRRHEARLFSFLHRLVGDREVAASTFEDAFVRALKRPGPWPTVLYRTAIERSRETMRLRSRGPELSEPEACRTVRRLVGSLPQKLREVFLLRIYQRFSYTEIADILGSDEATVRARMEHALQHLAEPLQVLAPAGD
ncbi:MAG: RNA polymerase sigma factor [Candidatus Xenobia bacterium]